MGVEHKLVVLRYFERQIPVPHKEVIKFVRKAFRIPMILAIQQQVPNDGFLLRQRFLLPVSEVEFGHQINGQTDQSEPGKALQCQPPR